MDNSSPKSKNSSWKDGITWKGWLIRQVLDSLPTKGLARLLDLFRFSDGKFARLVRDRYYTTVTARWGADIRIKSGVYIFEPENLQVGNRVSIQHYCIISCDGGVTIGNDVSIAHNCSILSSSHPYDIPGIKIRDGKLVTAPVTIGDDVWLGCQTVVLSGASIGNGCVIGAGAVVTGDIPDGVIAAGVPARVIKHRFPEKCQTHALDRDREMNNNLGN